MKKVLLCILLSASMFPIAKAQKSLYGKWNAECVFERNNNGSVTSCSLCPSELSQDKSSLKILPLTMQFKRGEVSIVFNKQSETIPLEYDERNEIIKFNYKNNEHIFKVLFTNNKKVKLLKSMPNGCLVMLTK